MPVAGKWDWEEGLALGLLNEVGGPDQVDAFELAHACGLQVRYGSPPRIEIESQTVFVHRRASAVEQQWQIAHELGHWLLDRSRETQSEHSADMIALALLMPRRAMLRAIQQGDVEHVASVFPLCPRGAVERRMASLRESVSF